MITRRKPTYLGGLLGWLAFLSFAWLAKVDEEFAEVLLFLFLFQLLLLRLGDLLLFFLLLSFAGLLLFLLLLSFVALLLFDFGRWFVFGNLDGHNGLLDCTFQVSFKHTSYLDLLLFVVIAGGHILLRFLRNCGEFLGSGGRRDVAGNLQLPDLLLNRSLGASLLSDHDAGSGWRLFGDVGLIRRRGGLFLMLPRDGTSTFGVVG